MDLMTIGAFAMRTRLSPKALRLYDRLGLLPPARTDPVSGYRFYSEDQVAGARLVALLRRLGTPLPVIADIAAKPPGEAAEAVATYWAGVESVMADRRVLVSYIQGIAGAPFLVFYGEVSDDSDGPMELCRPVAPGSAVDPALAGVQVRVEPAHDEVFIRLKMQDMGWPALVPAVDALEAWMRGQRREPAGALRQVLIADQRTAAPDTPVCDLSVPLR
jgi:DNA-binding transcriptional MerR regulator